jgi:integrase
LARRTRYHGSVEINKRVTGPDTRSAIHTRAWLDEIGAPVGVQQKLMRHAHAPTTMDQYGNALVLAKRKANRPIVQRLLRRSTTQQVSIQ